MNLLETRINHSALAHNVRVLKESIGPEVTLMAVVKADGYNHGAVEVARTFLAAGAGALGVATLTEAITLRNAGINAPLLCWLWSTEQRGLLAEVLRLGVEVGVPSLAHARTLVAVAQEVGVVAACAIKVETGMHRSGVDQTDWVAVFDLMNDSPHLTVTGLMSHFACADTPEHPMNVEQERRFAAAVALGRAHGLALPRNHLCNSPGALSRPQAHWDMVRVGIALYGLEPIDDRVHGLIPAMSWVGTITVVKPLAAGEGTSYALSWTAPTDGHIAIVPAGYADGLPRAVQGHLEVTIDGVRYPQVGRVCMDQHVVWLGDNTSGVRAGQEVTLVGHGPAMTATELASAMGTINYEIVCRPTGRTVRIHEEGLDD